ncbi:uncharacterized protein PV06_10526 [Exophiala oligosperma]|uniref:BZIP domain-containing protein n=1 Tax=Exophiala oligosperma TaxID=215243 RepID=A0A0D2BJA8_9EURO|nr:uncharacterized protein PV06_10526 [Exophiala oligosperma]KIW37487.1 hypothetical protein PV06_10526 [Exophiala oligosperma]
MAKRSASDNSKSDSSSPGPKKPRRMTSTQLDRKREQDRAAQRQSRARTRNHIDYLESLVKSLRADSDDRVADLLHQLEKKETEIRRLRGVLNTIGRQLALVEKETPSKDEDENKIQAAFKPVVGSEKRDDCQPMASTSPSPPSVISSPAEENPAQVLATDELVESMEDFPMQVMKFVESVDPVESLSVEDTNTKAATTTDPPHPRYQSITQLATSIASNTALEGRLWYLAGAILNQILSIPTSAPITVDFDEDIAIRAVFHGWTSVIERYSLDRGWQWLKELDERVYFRQSAAVRLFNLRNCRLIFLRQLFPGNGWDTLIPPCYTPQSILKRVSHDPLVEYFPWPGLREKILLSPLKFATNQFMDALRAHVTFTWNRDNTDLYTKESLTGLYRYSDLSIARLKDMRCYTMSQEFFLHFPELRADIPCDAVLPQSLFPPGLLESKSKDRDVGSDLQARSSSGKTESDKLYAQLVEGLEATLSGETSYFATSGIEG